MFLLLLVVIRIITETNMADFYKITGDDFDMTFKLTSYDDDIMILEIDLQYPSGSCTGAIGVMKDYHFSWKSCIFGWSKFYQDYQDHILNDDFFLDTEKFYFSQLDEACFGEALILEILEKEKLSCNK